MIFAGLFFIVAGVIGGYFDRRSWLAAIGGLLFVLLSPITIVPAGHVGIPVLFGAVQGSAIPEGLTFVNPFLDIVKQSIRAESYTMSDVKDEGKVKGDDSIVVLSKDGLRLPIELTIVYRLNQKEAPWVYQNYGNEWVDSILRPSARASARDAMAQHDAMEAIVSRENVAAEIASLLRKKLSAIDHGRGAVIIEQALLRKIEPPQRVKEAIEEKLKAEQDAQRMSFVIDKERKEAERKKIEAQGIRDFQQIVSEGIDERLLRWKGIDATKALAESHNTKIIIVGGRDGLPIIMNSEK